MKLYVFAYINHDVAAATEAAAVPYWIEQHYFDPYLKLIKANKFYEKISLHLEAI